MTKEEKKAIEYYQNNEVSFSVDFDTENLLKALGITEEDSFENHQIRFKTLLNLIEKLKKENEELKEDRNNNYQMIALAQNEALGYMQGYEDGKKLKRSAVAYVVENQQYYILNKQIEHYKEYIEKLQKENEELKKLIAHKNAYTKMLEKDLFENCSNYVISRQKIKDKIEEYKNILKNCNKSKDVDRIKAINERVLELEELLEKNEEESKCPKKQENKNIEK